MYKKLERVVVANGGTIFGGYLRDKILGVTPNDIDVMLSYGEEADFDESFRRNINVLESYRVTNKYASAFDTVRYDLGFIKMDLVIVNNRKKWDDSLDFTCNALTLDKSGLDVRGDIRLCDVVRDIMDRRLELLNPYVATHRITNMIKRGWSPVEF